MNKLIPSFIIAYSNSDFTNPHEVVWPTAPEDCKGDFTHMGAKYTGIETKRHVATQVGDNCLEFEHDCCNWLRIGLKQRAMIQEIRVSTKWFTGNQVRSISIVLSDELSGTKKEVLTNQQLEPDVNHQFEISPTYATEALINIYHEGGISRIHFHGEAAVDQLPVRENILRTAHISNVSNEHYGNPQMAVKGERKETHMVGWESARTGYGEKAIFHLPRPTVLEEIVVDTYMHRLNPPLTCHVYGLNANSEKDFENQLDKIPVWKLRFSDGKQVIPENFQEYMLEKKYLEENTANSKHFEIRLHETVGSSWKRILPFEALQPDTYHRFTKLENEGPFTHLLYIHYPNGGIHGLKVFGKTNK